MDEILEYRSVNFKYKNQKKMVLNDMNLGVGVGEFVTVLGDSGSGKTTLLKLANKLLLPTDGTICFKGKDINSYDVFELRKNMGYVIQEVGLFPHMNVKENISILSKINNMSKYKIEERVNELLSLAQLPNTNEFKRRHPWQLSGGQQQRVGLARALFGNPEILLMDEPFGALDVVTREKLQRRLIEIQKMYNKTILFVTHSLQEAITLGDKVIILHEGIIQQFDTPKNLVLNPRNEYVRTLFNAPTPVDKMKFFSVADFSELIYQGKPNPIVAVQRSEPMVKVLNWILKGKKVISVYDKENFIGNMYVEDLRHIGEI
jgi:osmoprotectant transport system ATP-binding protein